MMSYNCRVNLFCSLIIQIWLIWEFKILSDILIEKTNLELGEAREGLQWKARSEARVRTWNGKPDPSGGFSIGEGHAQSFWEK